MICLEASSIVARSTDIGFLDRPSKDGVPAFELKTPRCNHALTFTVFGASRPGNRHIPLSSGVEIKRQNGQL